MAATMGRWRRCRANCSRPARMLMMSVSGLDDMQAATNSTKQALLLCDVVQVATRACASLAAARLQSLLHILDVFVCRRVPLFFYLHCFKFLCIFASCSFSYIFLIAFHFAWCVLTVFMCVVCILNFHGT